MELGGKPRPKKKKTTGMDLPFFILILLLLGIGLIMLFSASYVQAINDTKLTKGDGAFFSSGKGALR